MASSDLTGRQITNPVPITPEMAIGPLKSQFPGPRLATVAILRGDGKYRDEIVRISELTVNTYILKDLEFVNCRIIGPAVLAILGIGLAGPPPLRKMLESALKGVLPPNDPFPLE